MLLTDPCTLMMQLLPKLEPCLPPAQALLWLRATADSEELARFLATVLEHRHDARCGCQRLSECETMRAPWHPHACETSQAPHSNSRSCLEGSLMLHRRCGHHPERTVPESANFSSTLCGATCCPTPKARPAGASPQLRESCCWRLVWRGWSALSCGTACCGAGARGPASDDNDDEKHSVSTYQKQNTGKCKF